MSSHPNAILMLTLQPQDLPRKTMRAILKAAGIDPDEDSPQIKVGEHDYTVRLMEESYDDGYQIGAPVGSIVFHDFLTYGYGEKIGWGEVAARQAALQAWAQAACEAHHCTIHEIAITANYW
jgi:hypothetical protein